MDNLDGKSFKEMYSMVKKMPKSMLEDAIGEHNKEIQQFLYENYNEEEVKKMEKLIAKRMKEEDSMFDMVDFPMEMLPSLGEFVEEDDMFDAMLENMNDEQFDTLMDQFENMDLSETIGGWNARKKRSVYGNYLSKKDKYRSNKKGHSSFKDMLGKMMNGKGKERMPKEVKDMSLFVKELIFMPDEEAQSMLGSRLPAALKSSMREVIMGFLTDDIPMGTLKLFGKFAYHMKKSLSKMVKGLLPVSEDAVNEMFEKITKKIENKTTSGNESMGASKNDWNMLKVIFSAVDKEVKEGVTLVAQKLQGAFVMDAPMPMMTGQVSDPPTESELCQGYASFIQNPGPETRRKKLNIPTIWRNTEEGIFKVEFCPLSGKWYESKMAVCSCKGKGKGKGITTPDFDFY